MTEFLKKLLNQDELDQLSEDIQEKLNKTLRQNEESTDLLKAEVEKLKAEYEQKSYEIDKKMIEMSTRLTSQTAKSSDVTTRCDELENEIKDTKNKNNDLEKALAEEQKETSLLKHANGLWKEEKMSLQHMIEKRDLEINELKVEWKAVSDKLATVTTNKNELELKLDELENYGVTIQYHNKRLEREKELLTQQTAELTKELSTKSTELNSVKLNKENDLIALRSRLELKMDECKQFATMNDNLRTNVENLEKRINDLLEKGNSADDERRSMEELYRNELQSQINLADLYKASAKDETEKSTELASAVHELQKLVTESTEANKAKQLELEKAENNITDMLHKIELLNGELEKANDLLAMKKAQDAEKLTEEELAKLCPTAAIASKFIKSGMTLTEIYTKYMETVDELDIAKLESKRVNDTMDAILEELNEKAPILKQQRDAYERALATITQMTSQMDAAAIEGQRLRADTDDAGRKLARVEREKKRLQTESSDLATQVRFLLKELEESRGHNISMDRSMESVSDVTSSSEVITGRLVTFKSIEELQKQNQKLLQVVRELSDEGEKREKENQCDELKRLKETLEEAHEELDKMREDRGRQTEFVEAIVRQRDMYRVLLAQEPNTGIPMSILSSPAQLDETFNKDRRSLTPRKSPISKANLDLSKALQVLKTEFDEYKKDVHENNKLLNEQASSFRSQITELRSDNTKLQSNVTFSAEKYNIMNQSFENSRKEAEILREKNSKLMLIVQKHELNVNAISHELTCAEQEKGRIKNKLDNLQSELDILRRTEERLKSDNSSLQRDQRGQTVLLANLQKIQQTMEKQEMEVRSELRNRIESQESELKNLRKSTNETLQQKQSELQTAEKHLLTAQLTLTKQQVANEHVNVELRSTKSLLESSKLENESNVSKVNSLEQRLGRLVGEKGSVEIGSGDSDMDSVKDLKDKCKALEDELTLLKRNLEKAQHAVQQHKESASAVEESLKQANNSTRELSEALELKLKNASDNQTKLEQQIAKLEGENEELKSKKSSLISEVDIRTADLNRQLTSLQSELDIVLKREKDLRKSEQDARNQYTEQSDMIQDAQNKYQREMLLHAESVKELMEIKEKYGKQNKELEKARNDANQAQHLLNSSQGMWEKQKIKLTQENDEIKERNKDLNEQLKALHDQLETMSTQVLDLQQKQTKSPVSKYSRFASQEASSTSTDDATDKSNEQLMDIIKFLRKEKNLIEVKCEVAQSECTRLKQQQIHLQKQVDESRKSLHAEQQKLQASTSELSKHESLMKKVETLNVLTDSNRLLRDERDRLQKELIATKSALIELKQKYTPLHSENNQLTTQISTLKSEKSILERDVQRWQQRSQQLIQSPRRQDPEEHRKLLAEKQRLQGSLDTTNKEVTEKKLELSNLQGEIRVLKQENEGLITKNGAISKQVEMLENDMKTKQTETEAKDKTIIQIKRVGRRYKMQFEELQKKHNDMLAQQKSAEENRTQDNSVSEATLAENSAKLAAMEASMTKSFKEKEESQKELEMKSKEVDALKSQLEALNQKLTEESKVTSSENSGELQKITTERDELKKQLQEKEDKSKQLLTMAKKRIEQVRKEKEELSKDRARLRTEDEKQKEEIEKLKQDVKNETDQISELQTKIEDLQKQLTNATTQQQQQNKVTSHQIHHLPGSSSSVVELRKAANIRPISTQRVSQVSPMRVTRTARVMPEPQQEAQEGSSTDSLPARSSPHAQVAPSSSHLPAPISVSTSTTNPTRAFVHPMNPSTSRQQHVVSSMPTSSGAHQMPSRSDTTAVEQAIVRGSTSSTTDNVTQEAAVSSVVPMSSGNTVDVSESDQAIVSSSDDQPAQCEDGHQQIVPTSGQTSSTTAAEPDMAPSQSTSASISAEATSGTVSSIPVQIGRTAHSSHKRSYEDAEESNSTTDESPASSSDAQISVAPVSKRQRSSPDQSSAAVHPITSSQVASRAFNESSTRIQQAESSVSRTDVKSSTEITVIPTTHSISTSREESCADVNIADTSTFAPIAAVEAAPSQEAHSVPTSSGENVIVLSSDESEEENLNVEQDQDELYVEAEEGIIVDENDEGENEFQDSIDQAPTTSSIPPSLVLHQTPDYRYRAPMMRPAPLTPGLAPPAADDGDGIVPCTPTLPTRRHDDNYQTIDSPRVSPGPPIRFRFENVTAPTQSQSFHSQSGIGSVDNTIMDFSGAGDEARSVPTTPVPVQSLTTVTHSFIEQAQVHQNDMPAVSSSITTTEQEDMDDDERDDDVAEVPISSSLQDETGDSSSAADVSELTSNLQSRRGRRIRLIGARSRGKGGGGTSPSTSNQ